MPDYRVLGGCLRSTVEFPELAAAQGATATWEFQVADRGAQAAEGDLLGQDPVRGRYAVRLFRTRQGYRLTYDDTGTYDVSDQGSRIVWYPPSDADRPWAPEQFLEAVRIDVLGRVLATALHAQGMLCLHGSAVRLGDAAIAFLAPKFHGKSTLAYALVAAGGGLITDDTLPVDLTRPYHVRAGVHNIRMWEDSARRVAAASTGFAMGTFGKLQSTGFSPDRLVYDATRLAGLYLLIPVRGGEGVPAVRREPLPPLPAALALVQHAKIGPLLGKGEAPRLLEWAADLSRDVPVQTLSVVRDFDRLGEAVAELMRYHGA